MGHEVNTDNPHPGSIYSALEGNFRYLSFQPRTKVTETYKGVHWGKYSNKRTDFGGKEGPGPGEYNPTGSNGSRAEHQHIRDEDRKKYDARIPRYHEWVVKEEEKKVLGKQEKMSVNC